MSLFKEDISIYTDNFKVFIAWCRLGGHLETSNLFTRLSYTSQTYCILIGREVWNIIKHSEWHCLLTSNEKGVLKVWISTKRTNCILTVKYLHFCQLLCKVHGCFPLLPNYIASFCCFYHQALLCRLISHNIKGSLGIVKRENKNCLISHPS